MLCLQNGLYFIENNFHMFYEFFRLFHIFIPGIQVLWTEKALYMENKYLDACDSGVGSVSSAPIDPLALELDI